MTIELPKQKRGGTSRPKDNSVIPPFGSAACASSSIILLHYHLIRPLARLGFCWYYCAARFVFRFGRLRGSASVDTIARPGFCSDSPAWAAARPRLDGCAAGLVLILSRGNAIPLAFGKGMAPEYDKRLWVAASEPTGSGDGLAVAPYKKFRCDSSHPDDIAGFVVKSYVTKFVMDIHTTTRYT